MKKWVLILFLVSNYALTIAQYRKMPLDTNHYWREYHFYIQGTSSYNCDYQYNVVKDTVVGGRLYKKVLMTYALCTGSWPCCFYSPVSAYLREDTVAKRVIILDNSYQEKIKYNFNKNLGDTANLYEQGSVLNYTVTLKDSLLLNDGLYHKRLIYSNAISCEVIEGIGGKWGLLTPYSMGFGIGTNLVCLGKTFPSSATIYHMSGNTFSCSVLTGIKENSNSLMYENISISPNPNNGSFQLKIENELENGELILVNLIGQEVYKQKIINGDNPINTNGLSRGLYHFVVIEHNQKKFNGKVAID